jgi:N-acetylglutamate synthase-like GNAT family acetyltransferase
MCYLTLDLKNISEQHICCGFSDKKCAEGYQKKKDWLKNEFKNGYKFFKLDERGKVFIEYVPIEHSWLPLVGQNLMVVNCFWVSGKFKKQGHGKRLLEECKNDARINGMDGILAVSSDKKRPFMSDPKFLKLQGFEIVDEADPYFKLWFLRLNEKSETPRFKESAKRGRCDDNDGIKVYYSDTCPFNDFYINVHTKEYAKKHNLPIDIHHITSKEQALKELPIPWLINSVFYKGELVTLEMKPDRHIDKLLKAV